MTHLCKNPYDVWLPGPASDWSTSLKSKKEELLPGLCAWQQAAHHKLANERTALTSRIHNPQAPMRSR